MSGKSSVARVLGSRLSRAVISTDDLGEAVRGITSSDTHPELHPFGDQDYREYTVSHSPEEMLEHSHQAHRALWPAIEAVVRAHATWAAPAVVEGWALLPGLVSQLRLEAVSALWLEVPETALKARTRANAAFHAGASDPERMIHNFTLRSVRFTEWLRKEAATLGLRVVQLSGSDPSERVAETCLRALDGG
jgi:2-phosphoglycerate kinase